MSNHPNIVLIMCDELRWNATGFAGNPVVKTPNLDKMASQGVHFVNAYCASPVCSPAKASWLTGLYPHAHRQLVNFKPDGMGQDGKYLPEDKTTIGEVLAGAGYRCGIVGPWHLGDDHVPQRGFEQHWETYGYQGTGRSDRFYDYFEKTGVRNLYQGNRELYTDYGIRLRFMTTSDIREQRTTWTVDRGIEFLHADHASPFFLYLSVKDPHQGIVVPEDLADLYPVDQIPLPANWRDTLDGKPEYLKTEIGRMDDTVSEEQLRRNIAYYYAMVTHVDRELGRFFEHLREMEQLSNTIIAFLSDHGEMLGEHGFTTKRVLFEGSVRVPLVLSWPDGLPSGLRIETPVAGVDLMPTLLDLAGVDVPGPIDGRSLAGPLRESREPEAVPVIAEIAAWQALRRENDDAELMAAHIMIRDGRWKYHRHRFDIDELYDLEADPGEMTNLAERTEMSAIVEKLRNQTMEIVGKTGPGPYAWCLQ